MPAAASNEERVMTALRFFLIMVIFCAVSVAWLILGATLEYRTRDLTASLSEEINGLWGPEALVQKAPTQLVEVVRQANHGEVHEWGDPVDPLESNVKADFRHNYRYKGLIWFSTYTVEFAGSYTVEGRTDGRSPERFVFALPGNAPAFENLAVTLDAKACDMAEVKNGDRLVVPLPQGTAKHVVAVTYRTQGRDRWIYDLGHGREETAMVRNFALAATTDFTEIDYPKGSASPTPDPARKTDGGMAAEWKFENRSTRQQIGIEMPQRANAGPIAGRMAFYAPVSLFFFFTVMFTIVVLRRIPLHPMHYLFISAGFFAFHILLAYLVDKIDIHYAFWICTATSVFLVVNYMRLVVGAKFAIVDVGLAQLVYLIGFSYAFFWTGWTGLTIVIVAIITLLVLMVMTARVDWDEVFRRPDATAAAHGPPAPPRAPGA
jgi:hypothetical protein